MFMHTATCFPYVTACVHQREREGSLPVCTRERGFTACVHERERGGESNLLLLSLNCGAYACVLAYAATTEGVWWRYKKMAIFKPTSPCHETVMHTIMPLSLYAWLVNMEEDGHNTQGISISLFIRWNNKGMAHSTPYYWQT